VCGSSCSREVTFLSTTQRKAQVLYDAVFPGCGKNVALLEGCQAALAVCPYLKSSMYRVWSVGAGD